MRTLICPLSSMRIDRNVIRLTGLMMAMLIALYVATDNIWFIGLIVVDYFIRAFTAAEFSPFSWLSLRLARLLRLSYDPIDKAPKIFAARVGFLFAVVTLLLFFVNPMASLAVGLCLMGFALLESVLDICVGCLVYTYVVLPLFGNDNR